jgi:uncharacterized protein
MHPLPKLTVRTLTLDLKQGFARHWHSGDAFLSMYYNALSMSFPIGEQSFIDSVRDAAALLPDDPAHDPLRGAIAQFIGQEATHRQIHGLYNAHLARQGLVNLWEPHAQRRLDLAKRRGISPLSMLAITAAYEHCTAVFGDGTLRYPSWFDGAEPMMRTLWRWHAAEETEHKAVAYTLYQTLGGSYKRRIGWYLYVLFLFGLEAVWQTGDNLRRDGTLFKPSTWWSALRFMWGRDGFVWRCTLPLLGYLRRGFHPDDHPNQALAADWLESHRDAYRVIREG